jgi:ketosteroid isomerase-like protein
VSAAPITKWLARYLEAWTTNDPATIVSLFSEDAVYRPTPFSSGWRGHDDILAGWLDRKDEPGEWTFDHDIVCATPELAVVRGRTTYPREGADYSNIWLVEFDPDGRCRAFTEWWVERNQPDPGAAGA